MKLNERQTMVLQILEHEHEVKIADLSPLLQVSEMTIRRDLEKLESHGLCRRTFGGAIHVVANDITLNERTNLHVDEKRRIGAYAAQLVRPGQAIFIDSGTTTAQFVKHLDRDLDITVVTNGLDIAVTLLNKSIPTVLLGGILREETGSSVGPMAEANLSTMAFDQTFLGAAGVAKDHGFSNSNSLEAEIKKIAIRQSDRVTALVDSSKFGLRSLARFADISQVQMLITNQLPPDDLLEAFLREGVELATV